MKRPTEDEWAMLAVTIFSLFLAGSLLAWAVFAIKGMLI